MATVSIRLDDKEKQQLERLVSKMGMSISTLFQVYAKRVLHDRKIPFEITALDDPFYSEENMRQLDRAENQVKQGQVVVKSIAELELMENA